MHHVKVPSLRTALLSIGLGRATPMKPTPFNQTTLQAFESPRLARVRRRDGSIERVPTRHLVAYFEREARAMRHDVLARWARALLRALRSAGTASMRAAPSVPLRGSTRADRNGHRPG